MQDQTLTKLATAQHQIDAAIRMLFLHGEDLIAIQTLCTAAWNIVTEYNYTEKRGIPSMTRVMMEKFYAEKLGFDLSDSATLEELERFSQEFQRKSEKTRKQMRNFLNHSNQRPKETLDTRELNPCGVITDTIRIWKGLNLKLSIEMRTYVNWREVVSGRLPVNSEVGSVHEWKFEHQVAYGRELLRLACEQEDRAIYSRDDTTLRFDRLDNLKLVPEGG